MLDTTVDFVIVGILGGAVGIAELITRYRDAPFKAIKNGPAIGYIAINVLASLVALAATRVFDWNFGFEGTPDQLRWVQVFASGFAAIIIFRSSLFTVKAGSEDAQIGPSSVLKSFLAVTDRGVDRIRAQDRAVNVARIMKDISYEKSHLALPTYILALMQALSEEDQKRFGKEIAELNKVELSDTIKRLTLGLSIVNIVGTEVLEASVDSLESEIRVSEADKVAAAKSSQVTTTPVPENPQTG
jgi:hypothetical protein